METINAGGSSPSWLHHPLLLSPCAFFSWALLVSYNLVEYACVSILITFYTQQAMQDQLVEAALFLCLQEGLASLTGIVLVRFTSRERLGHRFYAIVVTTSSFIASFAKIYGFKSAWILGATIAIFGFLGLKWVRVFQISAIVMLSSGLLFLFCATRTGPIDQSVHREATTVPKRGRNLKWLLMFSCITYALVLATGNIFFQEQGTKMEPLTIKGKEVRFSFMIVIKSAVNEITILMFGLFKANKKQGITLVRIGSGMACAIICCVIAWKVEIDRKKVVEENDPKTSVAWLCPPYVLLGLVEGLAQSGLEELFGNDNENETLRNPGRLSKDIVSCVGTILGIPCILIVRRWFRNFHKDEAHLDRYYLTLVIWSCVFFCIYLGVASVYMKVVPHDDAEDEGSNRITGVT